MLSQEAWNDLWTRTLLFMPSLVTAALLFLLFWFAGNLVARMIVHATEYRNIDSHIAHFVSRAANVSFLLFGAATGLGTLGVDVTAMVAGLGLTGFAIGFALKDIISNALAGILLMMYRPFSRNDHIAVAAFAGVVIDVNLRYTVLRTETNRVYVPNSLLVTNGITVSSADGPSAG